MQKAVYEFISKQTNDVIVERRTCKVSGTEFPIYQSDLDFYEKISPTFAGKKYSIPTPSLCPEERQRRRLIRKNDSKIYKRDCDLSKKVFISIYSPDKQYPVYHQDIWDSDQWDAMSYGVDVNLAKIITKQIKMLLQKVPKS